MTWTTPVHVTAPLNPNTWNAQVAENLNHIYQGKPMYLPTPSEDLAAPHKVHGIVNGAYLVPVICRDTVTINSMAYRSDTANGKIDLGIYLDDGNGTTCSKVSTTGLTLMPGGAGIKLINLALPAPLTSFTKYWLVVGYTAANATLLGTDGPLVTLCKQAAQVMPLPTVITWSPTIKVNASPCLAGFP